LFPDLVKRSLPKTLSLRNIFRFLTAALASLGALVVFVTLTPLDSWWARGLAGRWNDPCGDTLIVLSGAPSQGGVIAESTYWRSAYAVLAYRQCGARKMILTGGNRKGGTPVAVFMDDFVESQGVPRERVVLETRSTSTRENALYTQPMVANSATPPVLLTSDFHMFRARRTFEKLGMIVQPRPIPDVLKRATSWQGRWPAFVDLISETAKIIYYYARGWI
jgi:uncharacterized SAM-binding protein YcdF (DUF218 family)